jgi:hypothetical protein
MSPVRYAARTAVFAGLYLFGTVTGGWTEIGTVPLLWPPAAIGALWLIAQARYGRRNLDVIALSVAAALLPATRAGVLAALALAAAQVVPALLVASLVRRWTPGFWVGHGDRFRRLGPTLLRLAAAAGTGAVAGAALHHIVRPGVLIAADTGYLLLRDTLAVFAAVVVARAARRRFVRPGNRNRRNGLTVVR